MKASSLASVSATREVLEVFGLSTKYSLGQNFLINDAIVQKILSLAEVSDCDCVLEVGPGIGTLTIALLQRAKSVLSIERDSDLLPVLAETTAPWSDRFRVENMDALDLSMDSLCFAEGQAEGESAQCCGTASSAVGRTESFKLVSNLPYAVAATVVLDYFQRFEHMDSATVMVQREVAERMSAKPGTKDYGAYTVKLALFAEPAGRFPVGPGNFFPPPRVESAVIRLNRRQLPGPDGLPLSMGQLLASCVMADAAFAHRRKTLLNSFKSYFSARVENPGELSLGIFDCAGIDSKRRGETLAIEEFVALGAAYLSLRN